MNRLTWALQQTFQTDIGCHCVMMMQLSCVTGLFPSEGPDAVAPSTPCDIWNQACLPSQYFTPEPCSNRSVFAVGPYHGHVCLSCDACWVLSVSIGHQCTPQRLGHAALFVGFAVTKMSIAATALLGISDTITMSTGHATSLGPT